jgi:hypothetical protein
MNDQTRVLRHELKYMLNEGDYLWLRNRIAAAMPLDTHADPHSRGYHIRSLYYDDAYDSALFEKMNGDPARRKYRIRIYQYSDQYILLEKKSKAAYYTVKDSLPITREHCDRLLGGDYGALYASANPFLKEFYGLITTMQLRPKVLVDYFREAYVCPLGNVRITFDLNIHSGQYDVDLFSGVPTSLPVLPSGQHMMEVKYDAFLPRHIWALLQGIPGERVAVSKYVMCRRYH